MSLFMFALIQIAIISYAVVAGVFLAFSDFIMRSLFLTSGTGGIEAMQIINREVFRWIFMTLFLGMAAVSALISGYSFMALTGPAAALITIAGLVYLIGCFGVTIFFNVPMNEALADMDLSLTSTKSYWVQQYVPNWTFWNSVRTAACAVASGLLLIGLIWMAQTQ